MMPVTKVAIRLLTLGLTLGSYSQAQDQPSVPALEEGLASWYGPSFDGMRAASGEIFDSGQLTAAHRTLPFGTKVRVHRLDSAESIVVRINDRGPFVESRIIDLSYAAAQRLGVTDPGLFRVALEVVENAETVVEKSLFAVRVGTFRNPQNAQRTRDRIAQKFAGVTLQHIGEFWCVLVGAAGSRPDAETLAAAVRRIDDTFRSAYVVRVTQ